MYIIYNYVCGILYAWIVGTDASINLVWFCVNASHDS